MPTTEDRHTDTFYTKVDQVVIQILKNDRFIQNKRLSELTKIICEKMNVSERTAFRYIAEAKKEVRRMGKAKKQSAFKKAIQDREFIILSAKQNNLKLALDAMKDRDEIFGLYETQVKHSGNIDIKNINLSSLTDDQLIKLKNFIKNGMDVKAALLHIGVIIK
jgi:uncharacterized protein YaeQ